MEELIMDQDIVKKAGKIISSKRLDCVLSQIDLDGYPVGSTKTRSKNDGIEWITFCVNLDGNQPKRIEKCDRASVCFHSSNPVYNITLIGKTEIITDPEIKKEMWYSACKEIWSGPDDPNLCVLKFTTERYNLWVDFKQVYGKI
jgi:general stress protein 26